MSGWCIVSNIVVALVCWFLLPAPGFITRWWVKMGFVNPVTKPPA